MAVFFLLFWGGGSVPPVIHPDGRFVFCFFSGGGVPVPPVIHPDGRFLFCFLLPLPNLQTLWRLRAPKAGGLSFPQFPVVGDGEIPAKDPIFAGPFLGGVLGSVRLWI